MDTLEIKLTKGMSTIVDKDDFEYLNQWKWHFDGKYARRKYGNKYILMHRFLMNTPKKMETDHINRNKLDNRKRNLRVCSHKQNMVNRNRLKNNTSGFVGVTFDKTTTNRFKKWLCRIKVDGKLINLGRFMTKEDAAITYDKNATKYFGEFAVLNFQKGGKVGYSN